MENTVEIERIAEIRGEYGGIGKNKERYGGIRADFWWGGRIVWNCNSPRPLHNKYYVTFIMSPPIIRI